MRTPLEIVTEALVKDAPTKAEAEQNAFLALRSIQESADIRASLTARIRAGFAMDCENRFIWTGTPEDAAEFAVAMTLDYLGVY